MNEWLIDYVHKPDMTKEQYFDWRPAYKKVAQVKDPIAVEIGVLEGFNSTIALKYIDFGKYYLIDPYKEYAEKDVGELDIYKQPDWDNFYQRTSERFKDNPKVELIRKTSKEAHKCFPDEFFDFVYIDANHNYNSVWEDLNIWYPKVKKGGYIAGHDIEYGDVKSVVYRFYLENYSSNPTKEMIEETVDTGYNDWWMKRI